MRKAILVCPLAETIPAQDADYYGIDAGALKVKAQGLELKGCMGDFDSLEEGQSLPADALVFPVRKDETDLELALTMLSEKGYTSFLAVGALGGRLDHTLANLSLMIHRFPGLVLEGKKEQAFLVPEGTTRIAAGYKHTSFFALEPSVISLRGFDYPLDHRALKTEDIFTVSNAVKEPVAEVEVHQGRLLCVQSGWK